MTNDQFLTALARAFKRFMFFIGAKELDDAVLSSTEIREGIQKRLNTL